MPHTHFSPLFGALALAASLSLTPAAAQTGAASAPAAPAPAPAPVAVRGLPDFTPLIEQVGPAVVNIRTSARVRSGATLHFGPMDEDMQELFRRFFGMPFPGVPGDDDDGDSPMERAVPRGVGSGFIISADG